MATEFTLELYYESDDELFAKNEAEKLKSLVLKLAPHLALNVHVMKATNIVPSEFRSVPNHNPSVPGRQALLITNEKIGAQGWAGPNRGCLSKHSLQEKAAAGADSADITIHEWLHTIEGELINGRPVPYPDSSAEFGFGKPSGKSPDGQDTWHDWYAFALREHA